MCAFKKRTTAPSRNMRIYYEDSPFFQAGYGLPNCTSYAYSRVWELLGKKPNLSLSNAENWFDYNDGYGRGKTPKLGAVACWRRGQAHNSADGAGHVAIVEELLPNGAIRTSNSAWGGTLFYMDRLNPPYNFGYYIFQGFIYPPYNFGKAEPKKSVDAIAKEVIDGKWGNGADRKSNLTSAGYDYNAVQKRVNEMLSGGKKSPETGESNNIEVGDMVKVLDRKDYNGVTNASWVLNDAFKVLEVSGDRVVIGKDSAVTGAWHKSKLKKV